MTFACKNPRCGSEGDKIEVKYEKMERNERELQICVYCMTAHEFCDNCNDWKNEYLELEDKFNNEFYCESCRIQKQNEEKEQLALEERFELDPKNYITKVYLSLPKGRIDKNTGCVVLYALSFMGDLQEYRKTGRPYIGKSICTLKKIKDEKDYDTFESDDLHVSCDIPQLAGEKRNFRFMVYQYEPPVAKPLNWFWRLAPYIGFQSRKEVCEPKDLEFAVSLVDDCFHRLVSKNAASEEIFSHEKYGNSLSTSGICNAYIEIHFENNLERKE